MINTHLPRDRLLKIVMHQGSRHIPFSKIHDPHVHNNYIMLRVRELVREIKLYYPFNPLICRQQKTLLSNTILLPLTFIMINLLFWCIFFYFGRHSVSSLGDWINFLLPFYLIMYAIKTISFNSVYPLLFQTLHHKFSELIWINSLLKILNK